MLTTLYCVTMIQVEVHQLFQGRGSTNTFWSKFETTKCCGYREYTVSVIPYINGCKAPECACINEAKTSSK